MSTMTTRVEWKPCDLGVCAAEAGHKGTCAEASGWAEEWPMPPRQVVTLSYTEHVRRWGRIAGLKPLTYARWARHAALGNLL